MNNRVIIIIIISLFIKVDKEIEKEREIEGEEISSELCLVEARQQQNTAKALSLARCPCVAH